MSKKDIKFENKKENYFLPCECESYENPCSICGTPIFEEDERCPHDGGKPIPPEELDNYEKSK